MCSLMCKNGKIKAKQNKKNKTKRERENKKKRSMLVNMNNVGKRPAINP